MATIALSTLRSRMQTFLKDTSARKWTTDDLDMFINLAITVWTTDLPIASSNEYTVVASQHDYDLPENATSVMNLRGYFESSATEEFLAPMEITPGAWATLDEPRRYIVDFPIVGKFYLPRLPRETTFTLYYGATHNELTSDTDTLNLRRFKWGELAVNAYACYLAFLPYAANRARLEQWARRNDQKVDNPLAEEAEKWLKEYTRLMEQYEPSPDVYQYVKLERV